MAATFDHGAAQVSRVPDADERKRVARNESKLQSCASIDVSLAVQERPWPETATRRVDAATTAARKFEAVFETGIFDFLSIICLLPCGSLICTTGHAPVGDTGPFALDKSYATMCLNHAFNSSSDAREIEAELAASSATDFEVGFFISKSQSAF